MSFAAVVSLVPGVFLFRMASGVVQLAELGRKAGIELVYSVLTDAATATLILLAMGVGLIIPKLPAERFVTPPSRAVEPQGAEHVLHV